MVAPAVGAGGGRGRDGVGGWGLSDVSCHIQDGYITRSYCIAQRTIFNNL